MTIPYWPHFPSSAENKLISAFNKYRLLSHLEFYKFKKVFMHMVLFIMLKNQKIKQPQTRKL